MCGPAKKTSPPGQLASRELEILRIQGALRRAEDLADDVAAAIEASASAPATVDGQGG